MEWIKWNDALYVENNQNTMESAPDMGMMPMDTSYATDALGFLIRGAWRECPSAKEQISTLQRKPRGI